MKKFKVLIGIWIVAVIAIVFISTTYKVKSTVFYGIADPREIVVRSNEEVEIKRIFVVEGQRVEQGDVIVEYDSPDLNLRISRIIHEIDELEAHKYLSRDELISRISELKAQRSSKINEINAKIRQLEAEYELNTRLTSSLVSVDRNANNSEKIRGPIRIQIDNLKEELDWTVSPIDIRILMLESELASESKPALIRIEKLRNELQMLQEAQDKLRVYSPISGIIGTIHIKEKEKLSSFTPIISIHTESPSFIKGYIHEKVHHHLNKGDQVIVSPVSSPGTVIEGTVLSIGTRIVEYPQRLRRRPDIEIWGREVLVQIPEVTPLLLGEKVAVRPYFSISQSSLFARDENKKKTTGLLNKDSGGHEFNIIQKQGFEASGIAYIQELDEYLIVSDDTDDKKPFILLMKDDGSFRKVLIDGVDRINDMEAVCLDENGNIYISASQSFNKKGRLSDARKLFVKIERNGSNFFAVGSVNLLDILLEAAEKSDNYWALYLKKAYKDKTQDIEGIFIKKNDLYLGFKNPLMNGRSVILKIEDINSLMNNKKVEPQKVSIWRTFELEDRATKRPSHISDLFLHENDLYILSVAETGRGSGLSHSGSLWKYNTVSNELHSLAYFRGEKPEGITLNTKMNRFMIVTDNGQDRFSEFTMLDLFHD